VNTHLAFVGFLLAFSTSVGAGPTVEGMDITDPFLGWGGEGGQVFTSTVSLLRRNVNNPRHVTVVVDDLHPRGSKIRIVRAVVRYEAPYDKKTGQWLVEGISQTVAHRALGRRFEYRLKPLYKTPYSPRIARFTLPQGEGITAHITFHRSENPPIDRSQERDAIEELSRAIPLSAIQALPVTNPLRDPALRKGAATLAATAPTEE
jgi:hypothetical protein